MRNALVLLSLLFGLAVHAANPSYDNFNTKQFQTTGYLVSLKNGVILTNPIGNGAGLTNLYPTNLNMVVGAGLLGVTNNGVLTISTNGGTGGGGVTPTFDPTQFGGPAGGTNAISGFAGTNFTLRPASTVGNGLIIKGVTGQISDLLQLQNTNGTAMAAFFATGGAALNGHTVIAGNGASTVTLSISNATSQSVNGIEYFKDAATKVLTVGAAGTLNVSNTVILAKTVNAAGETNVTQFQGDSILSTNAQTGNYILGTNGTLTVSGTGTNYFGANVNVNGTINVTGATNSSLTASRMMLSGGDKQQVSAAASGAVPINADGSAMGIGSGLTLTAGSLSSSVAVSAVVLFSNPNGNSSSTVNTTPQFFSIPALARNTTETRSQGTVPISGVITNLSFVLRNIDTDGARLTTTNTGVAVVINGTTSGLWAVLNGDGTTTKTNSGTRSAAISQYDTVSLLITNSITAASISGSYISGSFQIVP